jgi:hypothetical protein
MTTSVGAIEQNTAAQNRARIASDWDALEAKVTTSRLGWQQRHYRKKSLHTSTPDSAASFDEPQQPQHNDRIENDSD